MVQDTRLYDILEVDPQCSESDLKKAYRRLSLLHHPDRQSSSSKPIDHSKFQEIQNAYETLSDPEKRDDYDHFGEKGSRGGGGAGMDEDEFMNSFMDQMFGPGGMGGGMGGGAGGAQRPRQRRKTQTPPSEIDLHLSLEELFCGCTKTIGVERTRTCATCKGSGAKVGKQAKPCVKCDGQGTTFAMRTMGAYMVRQPVRCPACDGRGLRVKDQDQCKKCKGSRTHKEKKKVEFVVERGMHAGEKIVLKGEGDESPDSSAPGDLYLTILPLPHPTFTLLPSLGSSRPSSIETTISLTLSESLLGFSRLILLHLDGRALRASSPPPGQPGWKVLKTGDEMMISGQGMWRKGQQGDLIVKIDVEMPSEQWAMGVVERGGVETLRGLLPPRREDLSKFEGKEVEEVDLEERKDSEDDQSWYHGNRATDEDEESYGAANPGCQQQ